MKVMFIQIVVGALGTITEEDRRNRKSEDE